MEHSRNLEELYFDSSWATIGSFDGVHVGHQAIIRRLVEGAHQEGQKAVVITFFPHPAVVLRGLQGPFFLTSPEERAAQLQKLGVDTLVTMTFDKHLALVSAEDFMRNLCAHLGLTRLLVGYDFALGKGRQGDVPTLTRMGEEMGYQVEVVPPVEVEGEAVSSSRIRALLGRGEVETAARLLDRPYSLPGTVVRGDGRGRNLGFPTANLSIWPERITPAVGVYATWAYIGQERYPSVTNIGVRPTFENEPVFARVETHVFDFDRDLYGQNLTIEFVNFLRREQRFPSIQALIEQIHQDSQNAREALDHAA